LLPPDRKRYDIAMGDATSPLAAALLPIATAAAATECFEQGGPFQSRSVIDLGDALARHPNAAAFAPAQHTATVRNYLLDNVVLDANSLLLLKDGQPITETAYLLPAGDNQPPRETRLTAEQRPNDLVVIGVNNGHPDYRHWLTECLPAIDWSLRQSGTHDVRLLLPRLQPWQEAFLDLLGHAGVPRLTLRPGALYHLQRASFCDFLTGPAGQEVSLALMETIRRIWLAVPAQPSGPRLLYIRAPDLRPRNEAAVLALLRQHGFAVVEPERLGTVERIALFREADVVIGPNSGFLADVVFCRPGALLWEFLSPSAADAWVNRLAQAACVDYWGDLFDGSGPDWRIDLGVLSDRLGRLAERGSPHPDIDTTALMRRFESLGPSSDLGLVQREAGLEPADLLAFAGDFPSDSVRLEALIAGLDRRFEGLGESNSVSVVVEGGELVVREAAYGLHYRTGLAADAADPAVLAELEGQRLTLLRQGLQDDLASGAKTFVWTSAATTREALHALLAVLWRLGPNALLWMVPEDQHHPAGSAHMIMRDFIKGYVQRPDPVTGAIHALSWFAACTRADELRRSMRGGDTVATLPRSLSLHDIAESKHFIEREQPFHGRSAVTIGDELAAHPSAIYFRDIGATTTIRNYVLGDVVLDGTTLQLLKYAEPIPETEYFAPPFDHDWQGTVAAPLDDNEVLIFGYNSQHWGYQHWLSQCLPAIDWSLRQARTRKVRLLLPDLEPWQEDFLSLLGHADVNRLRPQAGARYRLQHVEFSEFITGVNSFGVSLVVMETIRRILDAAPPLPSADRVLYIRNGKPSYGRIRNEDAVIALLRQHGVAIVEPEGLSTAQCIALFRQADVVIGPLGQHLAGVLFCRPGALLWEWMPQHYQNHAFFCLAQAAEVDYWGDLFATVGEQEWEVDLTVVERRLGLLAQRPAAPVERAPPVAPDRLPLDRLLLRFESLGDNCEFGMVQRKGGAEPLGLLRFNGIRSPPEERLGRLVAGLERRFEGLGDPGTCVIVPTEIELFVSDLVYDFWYHGDVKTGHDDLEAEARRQGKWLKFLRRKLFEDLESGDKILVWRSSATTQREQVQPLLDVLRRLGPNRLLWVTNEDATHPSGSVEELEPDFLKGYVRRLGTDRLLSDIEFEPWFELCRNVEALRQADRPVVREAAPPRAWAWFLAR
jgi:capsular polysaccharide biosynthesis protein